MLGLVVAIELWQRSPFRHHSAITVQVATVEFGEKPNVARKNKQNPKQMRNNLPPHPHRFPLE